MNDISEEGIKMLLDALPNSEVSELNLSRNPIKNNGAKYIGEMIVKGTDIILEKVNISECQITHKGAFHIYMGIKKSGNIRDLKFDSNNL
jgi:Ran GTPase-activating protein (RanGAP) involved in mRNA processing and transport